VQTTGRALIAIGWLGVLVLLGAMVAAVPAIIV
jgi:hypothetical protein